MSSTDVEMITNGLADAPSEDRTISPEVAEFLGGLLFDRQAQIGPGFAASAALIIQAIRELGLPE